MTTTTSRTTTTKLPTTKITTPETQERTSKSIEIVSSSTTTTMKLVITAKPTAVNVQTIIPSTLKSQKPPTVLPTSTISTSTHKRRKHGKHKHKKNRKSNKGKSSSSKLRTTTVSPFITTTKIRKVQEPSQVSTGPKNKTSGNKTVEKHDTPVDVQYTIIDEPVKENNASSGFSLHFTSCFGFILYIVCLFVTL